MYRLEIVTHPLDIEPYIKNNTVRILSQTNSGPLGMMRYDLETNLRGEVYALAAEPYKFSVLSSVLQEYNCKDFECMCDAYFQMMIGIIPDRYETHSYLNHNVTYKYPLYKDDYIYLREPEKYFLDTSSYNMLGYYPLHTDPLIFKAGKPVTSPILWGTACIIETRQADTFTLLKAEEARERMEYCRALGYQAYAYGVGVTGEAISGYTLNNIYPEDSIYHKPKSSFGGCLIDRISEEPIHLKEYEEPFTD